MASRECEEGRRCGSVCVCVEVDDIATLNARRPWHDHSVVCTLRRDEHRQRTHAPELHRCLSSCMARDNQSVAGDGGGQTC